MVMTLNVVLRSGVAATPQLSYLAFALDFSTVHFSPDAPKESMKQD